MNNLQQVQQVGGPGGGDDDLMKLNLEKLYLVVHAGRINDIGDMSKKELGLVQEGMDKVSTLHDLIARINAITDKDGKINVEKDSELSKLMKEAEEMGVKFSKTEGEFTDKERERVVENIRLSIESLNTSNDMKLQQITRLTNAEHEMYNMTRQGFKVIDEDKKNKIRNMKN